MAITSNDNPASIAKVSIASKGTAIPSVDDPSANAPTETSKPVSRQPHRPPTAPAQAARTRAAQRPRDATQPACGLRQPCAAQCPPLARARALKTSVRLPWQMVQHRLWRARAQEAVVLAQEAVHLLGRLAQTPEKVNGATKIKTAQKKQGVQKDHVKKDLSPCQIGIIPCLFLVFWAFSASADAMLDALNKSPDTASEVVQELVETGATLYGVSWSVSTQKQLTKLDLTEHYTQGLDYVDCEAEAAFCGLMNVTSYPTWQINGQLYEEHYPESTLEQLSELLDDLHGHHGDFSFFGHRHFSFFEILQLVFLLSIWTYTWIWLWFNIISIILYGRPVFLPNPSGKAKGAPTDVSPRVACVIVC